MVYIIYYIIPRFGVNMLVVVPWIPFVSFWRFDQMVERNSKNEFYYIILYYIVFYYIILYFIILYHIKWYYLIWYFIILFYIILCIYIYVKHPAHSSLLSHRPASLKGLYRPRTDGGLKLNVAFPTPLKVAICSWKEKVTRATLRMEPGTAWNEEPRILHMFGTVREG